VTAGELMVSNQEMDFLRLFYNIRHTPESVIHDIDTLFAMGGVNEIRAFPCFLDKRFLGELYKGEIEALQPISDESGITVFRQKYTSGKNKSSEFLTELFLLIRSGIHENVYTVLTFGSGYYFNRFLLSFFKKHYPDASMTFITHKKLEQLMNSFRTQYSLSDLTITRASVKSRVEGNNRKFMSSVIWSDFNLDEAFRWVYEENGWFQKLAFETTFPQSMRRVQISLSRQGIVKATGKFAVIFDAFLRPIEQILYRNVEQFSRRARMDVYERNIRPLYIDFGSGIFDNKEENQKFISILKKMKASATSVIHANPYLNLSTIDYYDGSIYDLWVLEANRLIIVPQMKSTHQALKRIINHIFDNFAEGQILENE